MASLTRMESFSAKWSLGKRWVIRLWWAWVYHAYQTGGVHGWIFAIFSPKALYKLVVRGLACNRVSICTYTHIAEREYDTSYFHNQVQRVLIDDHNVPKFTWVKQTHHPANNNRAKVAYTVCNPNIYIISLYIPRHKKLLDCSTWQWVTHKLQNSFLVTWWTSVRMYFSGLIKIPAMSL